MTVYPFQIHLGSFTITGFGIMMMVAFLVAGWAYAREVERAGTDPAIAWDIVVASVIGGLAGAKIYYAILVGRGDALLSRGGLVWYGGFIGAVLLSLGYLAWKRLKVAPLADLVAAPLAAGYSLGRVGCFLVGDDYGRPTDVPWAMAFPRGAPPTTVQSLREQFGVQLPPDLPPSHVLAVHPTQLYEAALAFGIFWLLWRRRQHRHAAGGLFALYLVLIGAERFVVEMVRVKDDRFLGPFSLAQAIAVAVMATGALLLVRLRRPSQEPPAPAR